MPVGGAPELPAATSRCVASCQATVLRALLVEGRPAEAGLQLTHDDTELTGGEKSRPERARPVLTHRWKCPQGVPDLCRRVVELPTDLLVHGLGPVWICKARGLGGVGGGTKSVRSHVGHSDGLTGRAGSCRSSRGGHVLDTNATGEPASDLVGGSQLAAGVRARASDECSWTVIIGSLRQEQPEHVLCAVGGPAGDNPTVRFNQRLT